MARNSAYVSVFYEVLGLYAVDDSPLLLAMCLFITACGFNKHQSGGCKTDTKWGDERWHSAAWDPEVRKAGGGVIGRR